MKPRAVHSELIRGEVEQVSGQATYRVDLFTVKEEVPLGHIAWEPRWRQYAFIPAQGSRYTVRVLRDINRQVAILMRSWESSNKPKATL